MKSNTMETVMCLLLVVALLGVLFIVGTGVVVAWNVIGGLL